MLLFLMISWITAWKKRLTSSPQQKKRNDFPNLHHPVSGCFVFPMARDFAIVYMGKNWENDRQKKVAGNYHPFWGLLTAPAGAWRAATIRSASFFNCNLPSMDGVGRPWRRNSINVWPLWLVNLRWLDQRKSESLFFFLKVKFIDSHDKKHMI